MTSATQEWTLKRLLEWTTGYLTDAGVDQPRLCAEILLADTLACQRIELYTNFDQIPAQDQLDQFRDCVRRCHAHEPVQYLLGKAQFFSLEFKVTPDVLIPRPETELLVTSGLDFLSHSNRPTLDVLDLCTGSGCIAVALTANCIEVETVASDQSEAALTIAQENITTHELDARITCCHSDLFENIDTTGKSVFDLIVSNPPYIADAAYEALAPNVRDHEPAAALRAGPTGLDIIRRIITDAQDHLADNGALMLEIAHDQAPAVIDLYEKSNYLKDITPIVDHQGHKRIITATKK